MRGREAEKMPKHEGQKARGGPRSQTSAAETAAAGRDGEI